MNGDKVMKNRKTHKMIYFGILLSIPLMFACFPLNYLPCKGQTYIIENIACQDFLNKLNEFREKHPEYIWGEDYVGDLPWRMYVHLYWKDLDLRIFLELNISNKRSDYDRTTYVTFLSVGNKDDVWKSINSKKWSRKLSKKRNEQYKKKFETEILDKLGVEWQRKECR